MKTSWKKISTQLDEAMLALGYVEPPCEPSEIPAWVRNLRFDELTAAEIACESYAQSFVWPDGLSENVIAQIHLRIEMGKHLCHCGTRGAFADLAYASQKGRPPYKDYHAALDSLLCRFWNTCGLGWSEDRWGKKDS